MTLSRAANVPQGTPALAELIAEFQKNEKTLHLIARQSLPENVPDMRLVVVVDQFEEVFTLCCKDELREALIRNLLYAAKVAQGQTLVILTMRADFYVKCAANAEQAAAFSDHHVLVGPMTEDELRQAIERPTRLVGCELEAGLVDLLVQDVRRQPGALPLLQHALLELWNKREGRRLTVKAYQEIGKLEGALQRRADAILKAFSQDEKELCRRTFLRLTQPGEGTDDTKRRVSMQELLSLSGKSTTEEDIIQKLADASLLTTEGDLTQRDAFVEVAHEALIRSWPQLRKWIEADRAGLRTRTRLTEAAREWKNFGHDPAYLYTGARLGVAKEWEASHPGELSVDEAKFLARSLEAQSQREASELEAAQRLARAEADRADAVETRLREEARRADKAEKRWRLLLFWLKTITIAACCALFIGILSVSATVFPFPKPLQSWTLKVTLASAAALSAALFVRFYQIKPRRTVVIGTALSFFSVLLILSPVDLVTRQLTGKQLVNSLGMRFVRVPGTRVLFSVWDTRLEDFEAFVKDTGHDATPGMSSLAKDGIWKQDGKTWKEPGFSQGPTYPVVGVSWNDAKAFCEWLTKRERSAGKLPDGLEYRLPTDEEWSVAGGLQKEEGSTPQEKNRKIGLFPWDMPHKSDPDWPPPAGAGNYAGEEARTGDWPTGWPIIDGYNDGYPRTSPVGSFAANVNGLYDMGGNVWQWCEDFYNAQTRDHVLRGASWLHDIAQSLLVSYRIAAPAGRRITDVGFRCVVAHVFVFDGMHSTK